MQRFLFGFAIASAVGIALAGAVSYLPALIPVLSQSEAGLAAKAEKQKTKEELIAEALERSSKVRGLYMTDSIANYALKRRAELVRLAEATEINAFVIDVKEVCGSEYDEKRLREFLAELKSKNIWPIARIVVLKDASQIKAHPEWYLTRKFPKVVGDECAKKKGLIAKPVDNQLPVTGNQLFWQDKKGGYWLDPAHQGVREYITSFAKKMIDLGFPEIQFDYIRFPSDGDIEKASYPAWDGKSSKCAVMKGFFEYLNKDLKAYRPEIILSADFFGYAALGIDTGIGQCIESFGDNFDYISFMLYDSHYYSGFRIPADPIRNLPGINFNVHEARKNPDIIVERSLNFARDYFDGRIDIPRGMGTTSVATTTLKVLENPISRSRARLRPWLEDFFHDEDRKAERPYGETKVRMQIDAAERATPHGWMLWNAANRYTEAALSKQ